jgi:hypothetical protein
MGVPAREICGKMDWQRRPTPLAYLSPDTAPLDFFMWGYVKNIVYPSPFTSI